MGVSSSRFAVMEVLVSRTSLLPVDLRREKCRIQRLPVNIRIAFGLLGRGIIRACKTRATERDRRRQGAN